MRLVPSRSLGPLLMAGAVCAAPLAGFPQETVEERMRVVESAVIVKPPAVRLGGLPRTTYSGTPEYGAGVDVPLRRSTKDRELVVYLGEQAVEVTGIQRIDRDQEWTVVIYLDAPLTDSETLFRSAVALAKSAERLTALGPVELLIADPQVRVQTPSTRFPQAIESALADVALQASNGDLGGELAALRRDHLFRGEPTAEAAEHARAVDELITRQVTEVSRAMGDRCHTDACLLLLVSEGFSEVPADAQAQEASTSPAACCAKQSRRLARSLAASRWLAGVVAVQERSLELESAPRERPPEARQLDAAIPPENYDRNAATVPSRSSQSISPYKLDLVVRLESQPLQRVARATGGFLAASAEELRDSLRELDERLLVWFRHPEDPPTDTLPLRVVFAPRGQELWAPRWWRFRHAPHQPGVAP